MAVLTASSIKLSAQVHRYRQSFQTFAAEQLLIQPKEPVGSPPIKFVLNPPQQAVDVHAEAQLRQHGWLRLVILKARQDGMSTWSQGRLFHLACLNQNFGSMAVANDEKVAFRLNSMTKLFYEGLDDAIKPMVRYDTKEELVFENPDPKTRERRPGLRSRIRVDTAQNVHAGSGFTIHALQLSEAAKYGNVAQTVATSLFPSVPLSPGTAIIIESTAFPSGHWFRSVADRARSGKDLYRFVFIPWFVSPEYSLPLEAGEVMHHSVEERYLAERYGVTDSQLKWRRFKIQELGDDNLAAEFFKQEYPAEPDECWINLDLSVFDQRHLISLRDQVRPPDRIGTIYPGPVFRDELSGPLWVWKGPEPGKQYDIGADVAAGIEGGDWSVAEVIDRATNEQVAEFRAHVDPLDFGDVLYWLGTWYNTAQIAVEMEGIGFSTNERLLKLNYPFLYIWRRRGKAVPTLTSHSGWKTQADSKKYMVATARHLMARQQMIIRSAVLWNELKGYSLWNTGRGQQYGAGAGSTDDCVSAWMIALVVADDERVERLTVEPAKTTTGRFRDPAYYDDDDAAMAGSPLDRLEQQVRGWR